MTRGWRIERRQQITDINGNRVVVTTGVVRNLQGHLRVALAVDNGPTLLFDTAERNVLAAHLDQSRDDLKRLERNAR
ncbi:hypothetical protein NQK81_30840 [Amycolatopsis roodepoortensis]|uniref:hypothetical protein n=1 Tax=Amycolatopsis roodepoortensis TaxID=700274 RepID=UPI00214BE3B0|nr:hypothetical protein [Amycolatopsis roodepoortensis]UUV29156.1 hypothetical protein NQK81_30840 [Amycolatopsis roodepoortensis]